MDNSKIQLIGSPCGHHGPYTFYKAFKYQKNGRYKILSLSDFFFVKLWSDSDLMSIGELILLWVDKNSEQVLASLRLYFLPENTPEGRNDDHGEDEVLAISEKVVLRADDLLGWITDEVRWPRGVSAVWERECPGPPPPADDPPPPPPLSLHLSSLLVDSTLDLQDVQKEKILLGDPDPEDSGVVVLSFARYCRYRGIMKRLEGVSNKWLRNALVMALGGFAAPSRNTRVLFCKDTFDYPDLEGHEQLCNHLAPNLKGRPRKKPKKRSLSPGGSESNESESSVSSSIKCKQQTTGRNGLRCNNQTAGNLAKGKKTERVVSPEEKEFLMKLHSFMKSRRTPISRVPHLGFKEIDLFSFFTKVQKLGGYNRVTASRLWKTIYDDLGGHQGSTSAATYTRRHYERLLLPYERSIRGEQGKEGTGLRNHLKSKKKPKSVDDDASSPDKDSCSEDASGNQSDSNKAPDSETTKDTNSSSDAKLTSLRNVRFKSEKSTEEGTPSDKENNPASTSLPPDSPSSKIADSGECTGLPNGMASGSGEEKLSTKSESNSASSSSSESSSGTKDGNPKAMPELIDLAVEENAAKFGKTPVPALKKRKLEILKEGGLEVTAISSLGAETSVTPVPEKRPSVIQHAAPVSLQPADNQVSITVTPDVSHLLGSPAAEMASTPSPVPSIESSLNYPNVMNIQDLKQKIQNQNLPLRGASTYGALSPPKVVQSRSIYAHSQNTVYGNPKDILDPQALHFSERAGEEILDLRVKSAQKAALTVSRVSEVPRNLSKNLPKGNNNSVLPIIGGRMVSSNLEITVVDVSKPAAAGAAKSHQPLPQRHQPPQLPHAHQLQQQTFQLPQHQAPLSRKQYNKTPTPPQRVPSRNENGKYVGSSPSPCPSPTPLLHRSSSNSSGGTSLIIPHPHPYMSTPNARSNPRTRVSQSPSRTPTPTPTSTASAMVPAFLPGSSPLFPGFLPPVAGGNGAKNSNPFLSFPDSLYYSSLYATHGLYPPSLPAGFPSAALMTPHLFTPGTEQLYKELLRQQLLGQQGAVSYLGLPRDGSTSITPVGPSTNPSTK